MPNNKKSEEKLKEKVVKFRIDEFHANIEIIFTNNIVESSIKRLDQYDDVAAEFLEGAWDAGARCAVAYPDFALFYDYNDLKISYITHEIFHLTHAVFACINQNFDYDNHECFAYLNGFLNKRVFQEIDKNGFQILI